MSAKSGNALGRALRLHDALRAWRRSAPFGSVLLLGPDAHENPER